MKQLIVAVPPGSRALTEETQSLRSCAAIWLLAQMAAVDAQLPGGAASSVPSEAVIVAPAVVMVRFAGIARSEELV